jgi:NADH:ubiquinone oxidoreductase subunit
MGMLKSIFTWWDGPTIGTALFTKRFGSQVGTDDAGNVYYESKAGRRWVSYKGANDAARVPPEWHSWLHHTVDTLPSDLPPTKAWEKSWRANPTGTPLAYRPAGAIEKGGKHARATGDYEAWSPYGAPLDEAEGEVPAPYTAKGER